MPKSAISGIEFSVENIDPDAGKVPTPKLLVLIAVFFATSLISVVTGSTSLITVPVMIQFGIEPHVAVATNMLALVFMSIGGSLPFTQKGVLSRERLPSLIALFKMVGLHCTPFLHAGFANKILPSTAELKMAEFDASATNLG